MPLKNRVRAAIFDTPLWLGVIVFMVLLARPLLNDPAREQSASTSLDDVFGQLSRGETAEVPIGEGVSIEVEPVLDENGNPKDLQKLLSMAIGATPKLLSDAELKYGKDHPKTISPRSAMVNILLLEKRPLEALELARTNFSIATRASGATPKQVLAAVGDTLSTIKYETAKGSRPQKLRELVRIVDEVAEDAPKDAAKLYIKIATEQIQLGNRDDAIKSSRSILSLSERHNLDDDQLLMAHMGMSGSAWNSGDCQTALYHAKQALKITDNSQGVAKHFRNIVETKTAPIFLRCG